MVTKIRYKLLTDGCAPVINDNGDAIDLVAASDTVLEGPHVTNGSAKIAFESTIIPLGIAMELPKGLVARVYPRSSTHKKWHILQPNSPGLIDCTYCGDTDQWGMPAIATATSHIKKGDRICQFDIRPSMKATLWQKIKWALTTKYEFVEVKSLGNAPRGGFGEGTKHLDKEAK